MDLTLTIQGWFYIITGLWPILHIKSFEMVSGPKNDKWLVKTVGLLLVCSGIIFVKFSGHQIAKELAILNASILSTIDIWYSARGVISKIYLLDAVIELGFVMLLLKT